MNSFSRLRGDHPLAVYIDLKSPYAYLAIEPTRAMAGALGVPIDWRPFTLDIPSYLGSARLDAKGAVATSERSPEQWTGVRYAYMDARRYANLTGKTVRGTVKIWNSSAAGIAMSWAKRQGRIDRFLDRAYPPFWRRELDIEDAAVLRSVLAASGVDPAGFDDFLAGEGRAEHDAANAAAFAAGVFGVPTYLVEDEMWFGREHLPRVAWLLGGRRGPAPEVANRTFGQGAAPAPPETASVTPGEPAKPPRHLTVALGIVHPACYLALEPTAALAEELGLDVDWLPIDAPPLRAPTEPAPGDDRGILHRRYRAQAIAREMDVYARARRLVVREIYRTPDTTALRLAWLWLRETRPALVPAFLGESFRAYWNLELDPGDDRAVEVLLTAVDPCFDRSAFGAWRRGEGPEQDARVAAEARAQGLAAAPSYRIDGELFVGRQHLETIRWIAGGRRGRGPI